MASDVDRKHRSVLIPGGTPLLWALLLVLFLHTIQLLFAGHAISISRLFTAAVPVIAAICVLWRSRLLEARERVSWRWMALALLLWALGQVVETLMPGAAAASNLSVDASDLFYLSAALPVLLAVSNTAENEAVPGVLYLNLVQFGLAVLLIYYRVFRVPQSNSMASSVMLAIYAWECVFLVLASTLRLFCWISREERKRMKWMVVTVWSYAPIEFGMDYATAHWHLRTGTLLDLLWSLPFAFAGWRALSIPVDASRTEKNILSPRTARLLQSLCPMLVTIALFVLAAMLLGSHPLLARYSILGLLVLQGLHAGVVQMNYHSGQQLLLEREQRLEEENAGLLHLSHIDPLTGVANRRGFSEALEDTWAHSVREQCPVSLLMIDLDWFKAVNDRHGHTYGDECLASVARILLLQGARAGDYLARYGGEEFVLLLPDTDLEGARIVAERMHRAVGMASIVNLDSPYAKRLTVSIGVATMTPVAGVASGMLLEAADQALYEAKRGGRNRVCWQELPEIPLSVAR
ncbi:sensor domain-containing diguanylate cyclase [Silvibacterium dinghuense]|uniref:diguanylate cyclase n=1 Tax=Silvibacterium dinghuense TaxID=1560006 RepID=A0A4Q1SE55_9BACT|nr:GGDEF domain-containing protein [Silvibacterium dinghuense]RXS95403.1 GGDEF domain-containing protein [Silvibacterium dinghuense]GGH12956.1 hypothetical protein GCM10011586_32530 [Silvibacterium dinghuense]